MIKFKDVVILVRKSPKIANVMERRRDACAALNVDFNAYCQWVMNNTCHNDTMKCKCSYCDAPAVMVVAEIQSFY